MRRVRAWRRSHGHYGTRRAHTRTPPGAAVRADRAGNAGREAVTSKRGAKRARAGRAVSQGSMLERVAGVYHLTRLGLCDAGLVERFEIGYASGGLLDALPTRGDTRDSLTHLGLLEPDGTERMQGCLTFPLLSSSVWRSENGKGFDELARRGRSMSPQIAFDHGERLLHNSDAK